MGKLDCFVWKEMCFLSKKKILQANLQLSSVLQEIKELLNLTLPVQFPFPTAQLQSFFVEK